MGQLADQIGSSDDGCTLVSTFIEGLLSKYLPGVMPMPMIARAAMKRPRSCAAVCKAAPTIMITQPSCTDRRRPKVSARYGTKGTDTIAPRAYIDPIRPKVVPVGRSKYACQRGIACNPLSTCSIRLSLPLAPTTKKSDPRMHHSQRLSAEEE